MNVRQSQPDLHRLRRYQYSLWQLLLAVAVLSILVSCYVWFFPRPPEAWERDDQIAATVRSLAKKRPSTMTREQWGAAVWWTENLVANSLLAFQAEPEELRRFQSELEAKTKGEVDMRTILWIWDQLGTLTPAGKEHQVFREHMLEDIEHVEPNENVWFPGSDLEQ